MAVIRERERGREGKKEGEKALYVRENLHFCLVLKFNRQRFWLDFSDVDGYERSKHNWGNKKHSGNYKVYKKWSVIQIGSSAMEVNCWWGIHIGSIYILQTTIRQVHQGIIKILKCVIHYYPLNISTKKHNVHSRALRIPQWFRTDGLRRGKQQQQLQQNTTYAHKIHIKINNEFILFTN